MRFHCGARPTKQGNNAHLVVGSQDACAHCQGKHQLMVSKQAGRNKAKDGQRHPKKYKNTQPDICLKH